MVGSDFHPKLDFNNSIPFDESAPNIAGDVPISGYQDYVPQQKERVRKAPRARVNPDGPVYVENCEYRSGKEQAKVRGKRQDRVKAMLSQVLGQYAHKIKIYKQAVGFVKAATTQQLADPDPKLRKAITIVQGGVPITKEQARAKALRLVMSAECH